MNERLVGVVQVYKGTLRPELGGGEVAVKVQRPGVLEQVGAGGRRGRVYGRVRVPVEGLQGAATPHLAVLAAS